MDFNPESIIGVTGVAFLGVLLAAWGRAQTFILNRLSFLLATVEFEGEKLQAIFLKRCWAEMKPSLFGPLSYRLWRVFVRSKGEKQHVLYRQLSSGKVTFWYKGRYPIWVSVKAEKGDLGAPSRGNNGGLIIRYIRGTIDLEKMLKEGVQELNQAISQQMRDGFYVSYAYGSKKNSTEKGSVYADESEGGSLTDREKCLPVSHAADDLGDKSKRDPIKHLVLSDKAHSVLQEIQYWFDSQEWFQERGIPWKRGYLLTGKPGTGKTSFARAVAEHFGVPMFILDLASMDNSDLGQEWRHCAAAGQVRVIVLEDLDGVFEGRTNIHSRDRNYEGCTFDCLLQLIDGADRMEGTLLFITTNRPETLDEAIGGGDSKTATRPGRVDQIIEFPYLDEAGATVIANRILSGVSIPDEQRSAMITSGVGKSPAMFQEACFQKALELKFSPIKLPLEEGVHTQV